MTKIGATDFGYRIAKQFGLKLATTRPGLVPIIFEPADQAAFAELMLASPSTSKQAATARVSVKIFCSPTAVSAALPSCKYQTTPRQDNPSPFNLLRWPERIETSRRTASNEQGVENPFSRQVSARRRFVQQMVRPASFPSRKRCRIATPPLPGVGKIAHQLHLCHWQITPVETEGYAKAEVTLGGIDTSELSSKTMEARRVPGLYFIGEVVDVTGWLGGYNFQWAWASGHAAGQFV